MYKGLGEKERKRKKKKKKIGPILVVTTIYCGWL